MDKSGGRGGRRGRARGGPRASGHRASWGDSESGGGGGHRDGGRNGHGRNIRGGGGGRGGRGRGSTRNENMKGEQFYSEEDLQCLSQGSCDDLLARVNENEAEFLNTFKRSNYCSYPLNLKRMIKLLHLLIKCKDKGMASMMLAQILSANGDYALFTISIDQLLKKMALEQRDYIRKENPRCIEHLIDIGLEAIKSIPSTIVMTFPIAVLEKTIQELEQRGDKVDIVKRKFADLNDAFNITRAEAINEARKERNPMNSTKESAKEPPEPFTDLSILPKSEEIHMDLRNVFLRCNKKKGGYTNWEHYFDIQFRLLREDFIRPLRKGIGVYCNTGSIKNTSDIRLYENAKILNPVCLFTGIGFQVRFDSSKLRNVNWEHSSRLIFGSLLCLSNDNFENCILFASVVKRDAKLLKDGLLTIKFEDGDSAFQFDPTESFKMVESTAYFEAYRHILRGLQEMSKIPDVIPMKKYIVDCKFSDIGAPGFLNIPGRRPQFDMKDVLCTKRACNFDVMGSYCWPEVKDTGLDSSQLDALKMALTKEVSVIQGPPGTGKTFIGLKIMETYLKNRSVWDPQHTSPILVVCFTNHALDQFLEGIQKVIVDGKEPNIIRVGGRCKSDALSSCVLSKKVDASRSEHSLPSIMYRDFQQSRSAMFHYQSDIKKVMENHDAEEKNRILPLHNLRPFLIPLHYEQLINASNTQAGKEIEVWLGLWFVQTENDDADFQNGSMLLHETATGQQDTPDFSDEDSGNDLLIEVDNEARVLHDERFMEGEHVEFHPVNRHQQKLDPPPDLPVKNNDAYGWNTVQLTKEKRQKKIRQGFKMDPMTPREMTRVTDICSLSENQRWKLYRYWISEEIKACKARVSEKALGYNAACDAYRVCQNDIDCFVAREADVIGMTTTGAAKYHHLLKNIHPKIVIFEEAAEILEAHIITSLSPSVQQLIMIGDHKQLRPKPTCYELEEKFNLGISLFERLVNNGIHHVTLEIQHRMRPQISRLIHPSIYKTLQDADVVRDYDHVDGVSKDVFFIDHTSPEEPNHSSDIKSHVNIFEAEYIVELCHYLLKQGYAPQEITILTMYRGQLLELKKRMKREHFQGVRVAAVDDFQGEENEIILLSLVRSNSDNNIGFLKIENRVCVALSRAKKGLYAIGNLSMLRESDSIWPDIIYTLEKEGCVGNALPLYCSIHPDNKIGACKPGDFRTRPEGGCNEICHTRLECGHSCIRMCHVKDKEHKFSTCIKICQKMLRCGHICNKKCYQCTKNRKCLPCSEQMPVILPQCGHKIFVSCSATTDPSRISCSLPCEKKLSCDHKCTNSCSEPCSVECIVSASKRLPCGHEINLPCSKDPQTAVCSFKCEATLDCGDKCSGTCGKCEQGRLHVKCTEKCGRTLVCGHACTFFCASLCPPCMEPCNNYCVHSKCPKECFQSCTPCMEKCEWQCPHFKCTKPCGQLCDRHPCNLQCTQTLKCGHQCIGICGMHDAKFGEKCPKECRICNKEEVCEVFFGTEEDGVTFFHLQDCGHMFESSGIDDWVKAEVESSEIQFKACPRCKTPIRKSLRYANNIKKVLNDVNAIKLQQNSFSVDLPSSIHAMETEIRNLGNRSFIGSEFESMKRDARKDLNSFRVQAISFQLSILPKILKLNKLHKDLKPIHDIVNISGCSPFYVQEKLSVLKNFVMQPFLSAQQTSDCVFELRRLTCSLKLMDLICKIKISSSKLSTEDLDSIYKRIQEVHYSGSNTEKISEDSEEGVNDLIRSLSSKYHVDGLSEKEKQQVVAAIGLGSGHWFKCPNGHYYAIGECGGATQTSICPECKSTIGGMNHALAQGNAHAGEFDGSRYAAWSDTANMRNLDPTELARLRI